MPQKSPSPSGLRSPRNRALEIGTAGSGFPESLPHNPKAGAPAAATPGSYSETVSAPGTNPSTAAPNPSPFKLGK